MLTLCFEDSFYFDCVNGHGLCLINNLNTYGHDNQHMQKLITQLNHIKNIKNSDLNFLQICWLFLRN